MVHRVRRRAGQVRGSFHQWTAHWLWGTQSPDLLDHHSSQRGYGINRNGRFGGAEEGGERGSRALIASQTPISKLARAPEQGGKKGESPSWSI